MGEDKLAAQCPQLANVDISKPRWDQSTYLGRAKHFLTVTNPLNVLVTERQLEHSRKIVNKFRNREKLPQCMTVDELWHHKHIYDSAFHPDSGEKMNIIGRMSAQVPMNMAITGAMMYFYKTTPAVIFWQWTNQSFNALVNYTNRGGDADLSTSQIVVSYIGATSSAVATAIGLNRLVKNLPPLVGRFVPFAAVCAANLINIPCMRAQELIEGTPIVDETGKKLGNSTVAAREGISMCILSRIMMAFPGMFLTPFVMNNLERRGKFKKFPYLAFPAQLGLIGVCLTFATPLACAVFKQFNEIRSDRLEPELRECLKKKFGDKVPEIVYYNKGL